MGKWALFFIPFSLTYALFAGVEITNMRSAFQAIPKLLVAILNVQFLIQIRYATTFGKRSFVMVYHNRIEATFYKPFLWAPDC